MSNALSGSLPALDPAHLNALHQIIREAQQTRFGTLSLDLRKDHHRLHLVRTFIGPDANKPLFPALARGLDRTQLAHQSQGGPKPFTLFELQDPPTNQFGAAAKILYCEIIASTNTAIVGGVVTLLEAAQSVQVDLKIIDNNTGNVIAEETPAVAANVYSTQVTVQGVISQPYNITAVLTALIQPVGGGTMVPLADTCINSGTEPVQSVTVQDPVSKQNPPRSYIKIGLNRTQQQQPDCDYWYSYGTNGPQPIVGVAVNGSAQLTSPPYSLASQPGFNGYLYLYRRDSLVGGGACIVFAPGTDMSKYVTAGGTQLSWSLPTDTFQKAPWDQNQTIDLDFFLEFAVQQGGQPAGLGRVRVTSIPQTYAAAPPSNVKSIPPLTFVWGCLRGGTAIETLDGPKAVEDIVVGDRVCCADGSRALPVTRTWIGWETSPLIRLVDEAGRSVEVTALHPVATAVGLVAASALEPGMTVRVAGGELARLVEVMEVPFAGSVYNIELGPAEEQGAAFLANGFAVGDNRAQGELSARLLERQKRRSLEIPEEWAIDIHNSRRRAAGRALRADFSTRTDERQMG